MRKVYSFLLFLLFIAVSSSAQYLETFESQTHQSTSFTSNGQVFNITSQAQGPFRIKGDALGWGWNGTTIDHKYIDNYGSTAYGKPVKFTISAANGTGFTLKSMYLLLSGAYLEMDVNGSTLTITGKRAGVVQYTASASSGFTASEEINNGYTLINMATYGGADNSSKIIDQFEISSTGKIEYVALDAMRWQALSTSTSISVTVNSQTNVSCNGGSNGAASIAVSGGAAPYTYSWSPSGGIAATATGLAAGTYTVTVKDANNTIATKTINITQPSAINVTGTQTNSMVSSGSASVAVTGGTAPYTYRWMPLGGTGATASGLFPGTYTCTVTDGNGCTATKSFTITMSMPTFPTFPPITPTPVPVTVNVTSQTNVSCNGGSNGSATASASGGVAPYTYSWSPYGGNAATATGLPAGTYTVTAKDANGTTSTKTITITQSAGLNTNGSQVNVSCNGGSNGSASISVAGGTAPYTYSWTSSSQPPIGIPTIGIPILSTTTGTTYSPTSTTTYTTTTTPMYTTPTVSGLAAGTWTCIVTDANGCTVSRNYTITQPEALSVNYSQINVSSYGGNDGSASISVWGGTMPYTYSWSPSGGTAATASNLSAGTYACTITDANGCTATRTVTITQPAVAPLVINLSSQTNVSCNGGANGSATVSVTGGVGSYSYLWTPKGGTAATAKHLTTGTYTVTVVDNLGNMKQKTVTITEPTALTVTATSQTNVSCFGGSNGAASVSVVGGTAPYTYNWASGSQSTTIPSVGIPSVTYTIPGTTTTGDYYSIIPTTTTTTTTTTNSSAYTTPGINGLAAGIWTCTITDANGCTVTKTFTITQPNALNVSSTKTDVSCFGGSNGAAAVSVSGGTAPYSYSWAPYGGIGAAATGLSAGAFTCTITDANGCVTTKNFTITQPGSLSVAPSQTNVSCHGGSDGSASVSVSGGTAPYTYYWTSSSQQTNVIPVTNTVIYNTGYPVNTFTNATTTTTTNGSPYTMPSIYGLSAGTWTCIITDANGCTTSKTFTITQPAAVAIASVSGPANGTYKDGDHLDFTVNYNQPVTVNTIDGIPYIKIILNQLETVNAKYISGSGTTKLTFRYVIDADDKAEGIVMSDNISLGDSYISAGKCVPPTMLPSVPSLSQVFITNYSEQTITFGALANKTYGDVDFNPGAHASSQLPVSYTSSNTSVATIVSGKIHIVGAGTTIITASQQGDFKYHPAAAVQQTLTVNKKTVTVTAAAKSKIYGDADPALTYTVSPSLVNGDAFSGKLSRAAGENAGTYAINQGTLSLNNNYTLNYTGSLLTINKKAITVTAEAKWKTYGETDPALTYTVSPALVSGDVFGGKLKRVTGENAGTYAIEQNSLSLSSNYVLNYTSANFTIAPKTVTVSAVARSKTYGDADPALTYTVSPALVNNDVFSGSLSRTSGESAGTYTIIQHTLSLSNNYLLQYTPANFTINKKAVTVAAVAKSKTYGDADPILTYTVSPTLVEGDSFNGKLSRASGENVGTYTIHQNTLSLNTNYVLNYTAADLTIKKKAVTVTAESKAKTYGDADPVLTYTVTPSLVNGDSFSGSLKRAAGENVGTYAIQQNTLSLNGNYALNYTSANLMINKKQVTLRAEAKSKTYGDPDPVLTYSVLPALVNGDAFTGSLSRAAGENAGIYSIDQHTLSLSNNYLVQYVPANLTINKKTVTVTAQPQSKVYGDADPELSYSVTPSLISGDVFTGSLSRVTGEDVGTYAIQQHTLSLSKNYVLNYADASLMIRKKEVTVTAENKSKTYGDADPQLTYNVTPALVSGDAFSGALSRESGENAGVYTINLHTLALSNNYTLNFTGATFTIQKKEVTATAVPKSKTYGDVDPVLTYTVSPSLVGQDAFQGSLKRAVGENVGSYSISQGTLLLSNNYVLNFTGANLTINKKTVTVTAAPKSKVYGAADPELTYTVSPVLFNGDAFSGTLQRVAGEDAGNYAIEQGNLANPNYAISFKGSNFTIKKATQQLAWSQSLVVGCDGISRITLTARSNSGLPVSYASANESIATISGNEASITGAGTVIITASQPGNHNYHAATDVRNTMVSKLPARLVVKRWEDVLVFDNSSNQYAAWQWYKDGAAVPGATGQYYHEKPKLNGDYYAQVKTKSGVVQQTCPLTVTPGTTFIPISVFPNPVELGRTLTVKTGFNATELQGATIVVSNIAGVVMQVVQNITPQTAITMPNIQGLYIIRLKLANGVTASVNVSVKSH